jgi:hypothetical protein
MENLNSIDSSVIESILEKANLYWSVKKEKTYLSDGTETGYFAHVRQDTEKILGSSKDSYEVFQNWESAELIARVAEKAGFTFHGGGSFGHGGKIFLQLLTNTYDGIGKNNDRIKNFATVINSFDGSTSLKWGLSNLTISCQNTFWANYKQITNRVSHTKNMRQLIDNAMIQVDVLRKEEDTLYKRLFNMADVEATDKDIKRVIKTITGMNPDGKLSDFKASQIERAEGLARDIVTEVNEKGKSLWGLFSGVTRYTTHTALPTPVRRERAKAFGKSQEIDNLILRILTSNIEEEAFDYV